MQDNTIFEQHQYSDVAFVVLSCDKYADLWPTFFATFYDHWPDCPFQVYLLANKKKYVDHRVITLQSGDDVDWSSSVRKAILQLKENNIFFFYEDAFLKTKVLNEKLKNHIHFFFEHDLDYFRLRPTPKPDEKYNDWHGRISEQSLYRVSLFASIWKKSVLLDLLNDGENAWEFEIQGTLRSRKYPAFYSAYKPFFNIIHGVERGKWINSAYRTLLNLGYKPEPARGFLYSSKLEELFIRSMTWSKWKFINLFPATMHRRIIQLGGNIKRKLFHQE